MAVVELCDRMVSLLVPLLTPERTKIMIQHGNIGEWHWKLSPRPRPATLSDSQSQSPAGSSPPVGHLLPALQPAPNFLCAV